MHEEYEDEIERAQRMVAMLQTRVDQLEAQLAAQRPLRNTVMDARLSILLSISAAMLVSRELDTILRLVVSDGSLLFPGVSGALLFLADPNAERLVLRAASPGPPTGLTILPGQGLSGKAFLAPRAMLLVGPELEEMLGELEAEHISHYEALLNPWPPTSALLAPLRASDQRLGSLVFYGGTQAHLFVPRDLPFAQALADLAAVAIGETQERARARALQRDLAQTQSMHAEAQERLNAAQAQLLQSAKLAAVGELAASVAHEINNPLYAARNSLYLVAQDLPEDAPQRPFLDIAQNELSRIARIITRMRDFYRPTRADLEPTDVNRVIAETIELVQTHLRHSHIGVETDFSPLVPQITAHPDQMRQVFLNLMLNACDAMPGGGTLHASTALAPLDAGAGIVIRIADTGTGIPPEHLQHLFEPFYTTKPHGTGLGLAISAHIVTQHGGRILVDSEVGQGSTFTITLPIKGTE